MAYIAVSKSETVGIGSGFHVGEGVFITARHVVEDAEITEVRVTDRDLFHRSSLFPKNEDGSYTISQDSPRMCVNLDGDLKVIGGPYFHPDPAVDLAAIRVSGMHDQAHNIRLGGHLDDWVGQGDFELSRVIVLGYPPVPFTRTPVLVAQSGEVNATVDLDIGQKRQLHFLVSPLPRGGFSGGLVMSEWGFALGVITQSLYSAPTPAELGFFAATSIEDVYIMLASHSILPKAQNDDWDGLWDNYKASEND